MGIGAGPRQSKKRHGGVGSRELAIYSGSVHQCPGMAYTRSFLSAIENMLQHAATRSNPAHKTGFVITYGADVAEFKASDAGGGGAAMLECAALVAVADLAAAHGRPVLLERANWGQY